MTYSSSLSVNRQRFAVRNQNTTSFRLKEQTLGPVSNTIILIVLACLLGLLYLTQVTKTNSLSYKINDLKEQQSSLKDEHAQLEVDAARLQSIERVKSSKVAQSMRTISPGQTLQN